jgi:hypothetical protein
MGLGNLAEGCIMSIMRNMFTYVQDASKIAAACDVHVYVNDGLFFAVESKNKSVITHGDIEKFNRDIEFLAATHGDSFIGALFVSTRSLNIPGKGSFSFNVTSKRPVVYMGFSDLELLDKRTMELSVKLLIQTSKYIKNIEETSGDIQDMMDKVRPFVQQIAKSRTDIDRIKQSAAAIIKSSESIDADLATVFEGITKVVGGVTNGDLIKRGPRRLKKNGV